MTDLATFQALEREGWARWPTPRPSPAASSSAATTSPPQGVPAVGGARLRQAVAADRLATDEAKHNDTTMLERGQNVPGIGAHVHATADPKYARAFRAASRTRTATSGTCPAKDGWLRVPRSPTSPRS